MKYVDNVTKSQSESSYFSLYPNIAEFKDIRSHMLDYREQILS